jgi:lipid-binding SYLF domain-containing protein
MREFLSCLTCSLFAVAPFFARVASASDQTKDDERLRNCGTVLKEILDVPDGGQATDFVLLVMTASGARGILASKVKLGADASVAAGAVGRDSSALRSEILSYSRARGLFAGLSLGSAIRPDNGDNQDVYGRKIPASDIVPSRSAVPPPANQMISALDAKTPKHRQ